ncbi:hypothetical protein PsorP6_011434 [Peronosclerospora sorghi]|uniref:Uncharacterized protein n=1 Tax=Peronosclerospora sorghi TaxID=230839 RepID=A0ACC0WKG8_9STRA|nr:hypothetical protein PsorP6_011434 [Peronosclerospora sorghi]
MESIQQEMEPFQAEMNALRSVTDTTKTEIQLVEDPVTNAKKALEANSCSIIEAEANLRGVEKDQNEKREKNKNMQDRVVVAKQELDLVKSKESSLVEQYHEARSKDEEASGAMHQECHSKTMGCLGAIDSKYDIAISTVCGALNNLVVETTSGAQPCVKHLRKHNLGRTTFLILEQLGYLKSKYSQHFPSVRAPSGKEAPRLFDLGKVNDDKYLPAYYYALRNTLVAKDLDEASAIAYQGRQCKYRVVTWDGQLVEMSGAMSGW